MWLLRVRLMYLFELLSVCLTLSEKYCRQTQSFLNALNGVLPLHLSLLDRGGSHVLHVDFGVCDVHDNFWARE